MRSTYAFGALLAACLVPTLEHVALACGGCFTPPSETESVITDEKMILSVSMTQTTLYDQISYSGSPASFAWVLPIKGTVTVGLSADVLFEVINQLTTTTVEIPPTNCPPTPTCVYEGYGEDDGASADDSSDGDGSSSSGGVTVTSQAQVGPYETVQLHSTDGSALNDWLTSHGYQIPDSTKPIIDSYVTQGFDFLALKLVPGEGVQSMQPVRVTSQGAAPTLPLHMVAVGTGPTTGITIWVIADGRWQPSNFPTFTIADSEIAWDWATSSSNYETLRLSKEATYGGRGWQVESSLELNQNLIQSTLLSSVGYGEPGGYVTSGGSSSGDGGTGSGDDSSSSDGSSSGGDDDSEDATLASADLTVFFSGIAQPNVRITRMRSDVAQSALSVDMILEASTDQSELTNTHYPGKEVGEPLCPVYDNQCEEVGTVPRSQAQAQAQSQASVNAEGGSGCSTVPPSKKSRGTLGVILAAVAVVTFRLRARRRR